MGFHVLGERAIFLRGPPWNRSGTERLNPSWSARNCANPAITLSIYSHLFNLQASVEKAKDGLEASFPAPLVGSDQGASGAVPCGSA